MDGQADNSKWNAFEAPNRFCWFKNLKCFVWKISLPFSYSSRSLLTIWWVSIYPTSITIDGQSVLINLSGEDSVRNFVWKIFHYSSFFDDWEAQRKRSHWIMMLHSNERDTHLLPSSLGVSVCRPVHLVTLFVIDLSSPPIHQSPSWEEIPPRFWRDRSMVLW